MMRTPWSVRLAIVVALALLAPVRPAVANPEGTLTWAVHISLAPTFSKYFLGITQAAPEALVP